MPLYFWHDGSTLIETSESGGIRLGMRAKTRKVYVIYLPAL